MITIGLTGGIGSGKSTVAEMLVARGAAFINADLVGHRSYLRGTPVYDRLVEAFGARIVSESGEIDRKELAALVFASPRQREKLNAIVWPAMEEMIARELDDYRSKGVRLAVLEAAILIEAGWQRLVDEIWFIIASPETAVRRLEVKGMARDQAKARIRSQLRNAERIDHAHVVIENDGSKSELEAKVISLWERLQERIAGPARRYE